jgi:enterobacterial common antigen flippase
MLYPIVRRLSGFRWSSRNTKLIALFTASIAVVFCSSMLLSQTTTVIVGMAATAASAVFSLHSMVRLVSMNSLPRIVQKLLLALRIARPEHVTVNP